MPEFLSSKVVATEAAPLTRTMPVSAAAVAGIVGTASWGPIGEPVLCTSFDDFRRWFGGYSAHGSLAACAQAYFANGGARLYVVRTAHYADASRRDSAKATHARGDVQATDSSIGASALYAGTHGNGLRLDVSRSGDAVHLHISRSHQMLERWRGLPTKDACDIVNRQSRYIKLSGHDLATLQEVPQTLVLVGGDDGPAIDDADIVGDARARTGLHALDRVLDLSILLVPGAKAEAQRQALVYCQTHRKGTVFALLDVPQSHAAEAATTYVQAERIAESSEYGAIYWPHLRVPNPAPQMLSSTHLAVPPSPFVAGVLARLAASRPGGVYLPPAGLEAGRVVWATGVDEEDCIDEAMRDLVFPARINPITTGPGLPIYIDGSRTLKTGGLCPWVAQRRGLSFIARGLKARLEYLRHRLLDTALLAEAYREVTSFLMGQMKQGAFASRNPKDAFHVSTSHATDDALLQVAVGMAFAKPAEFVWLQLSVDLGSNAGSLP